MSVELSILIATHNRSAMLRRCLEALAGQDVDRGRFEVIVADDGSGDDTPGLLAGFQTPYSLKAIRLEQIGRGGARNAALAAASGRVCLIIDDDVIASTGLVAAHLAAHSETPNAICIGRLEQARPSGSDWYARAFATGWNRHYESLDRRGATWTDCYGGNLSVAREALLAVGGFASPDLPIDDIDLAFRLGGLGYSPLFVPRARAVHDDEKPRRRLLRDSRLQGAAHVEMAAREPAARGPLLGWFAAATPREVTLRRLLISLRAPVALLARAGRLLPGEGRRQIWFEFVSRFAFWRAARLQMTRETWVRTTRGVPVLMYHAFSERDEGDRYVVSRRQLIRQLRVLRLMGLRTITLSALAEALHENRLPPPSSAVITFDDGYADNLEVALPLLRRRGIRATLFLLSDRPGGVNDWTREGALAERPLLTFEAALAVAEGILEYGAHTRTHPDLEAASDHEVTDQVAGSREQLERDLGRPVTAFAYPFGRFDERAVDAVREAGYESACTVEPRLAGLAEDPLRIPRVEVRSTDSLRRFAFKLWFGGA